MSKQLKFSIPELPKTDLWCSCVAESDCTMGDPKSKITKNVAKCVIQYPMAHLKSNVDFQFLHDIRCNVTSKTYYF